MSMPPSSPSQPVLQLEQAAFSYAETRVFQQLDLNLHSAEIVALCGPNGCGKSTLLRCLSGDVPLTHGRLIAPPGHLMALLEQEPESTGEADGREARLQLLRFQQSLFELAERIADDQWELISEFESRGGYAAERLGEQWARRFGVAETLDQELTSLSLGQRRKIDLSALFAADLDLVLLDEPTNYLDLAGLAALEEALERHRQSGKTAVIISHDRQLLDRVATRTVHMELSRPEAGDSYAARSVDRLREVNGGYSDLLQARSAERDADAHRAAETSKRLRALEADLRRKAGWADKKEASKRGAGAAKPFIAKRAKKMMKRAKDVERRVERQIEELQEQKPFAEKAVALQVPKYTVARRSVFSAFDLELAWVHHAPIRWSVSTDDRIGILGTNGCGKTTLLNTLVGCRAERAGTVQRNDHVNSGFLTQGLHEFFDQRPLIDQFLADREESVESVAERETLIRTALGSAGIRRDRVFLAPAALSMGERMRAALVRLALAECEFIVLDEPTTHLDLESIEVLEDLLRNSSAGFLMVSHDRRLVERTCHQVFHFSDQGLREI